MIKMFYFMLCFALHPVIFAMQYNVNGMVIDAVKNIPLNNANIVITDLEIGTASDYNGYFSFKWH